MPPPNPSWLKDAAKALTWILREEVDRFVERAPGLSSADVDHEGGSKGKWRNEHCT